MNMTAETRASAYVRKLRVGDKFTEFDGKEWITWTVTREPEVVDGKEVHIYLLAEGGKRARSYAYEMDSRVRIA